MSELFSLYKLHKVDSALHSLRQEAAGLDTGQEEAKELKGLQAEYDVLSAKAKSLTGEQRDLELQQKSYTAKIEGFSKKLYDGSVVSPKEVENIEKEIAMLRGLVEGSDERLLELFEEAPPAVAEAEAVKTQMDALQARIEEKRKAAVERHAQIKKEFDALKAQRPQVAAEVEKALLSKYEDVRKRTGDVAMADVTENGTCSQCGMLVPTRQSKMLDDDRLVQCEGCHRILFKAVPAG
jgi:predicted  nucleic acid-binding Zn-ribbon protein